MFGWGPRRSIQTDVWFQMDSVITYINTFNFFFESLCSACFEKLLTVGGGPCKEKLQFFCVFFKAGPNMVTLDLGLHGDLLNWLKNCLD
jgi:hypothetical protein